MAIGSKFKEKDQLLSNMWLLDISSPGNLGRWDVVRAEPLDSRVCPFIRATQLQVLPYVYSK